MTIYQVTVTYRAKGIRSRKVAFSKRKTAEKFKKMLRKADTDVVIRDFYINPIEVYDKINVIKE